MSDIDEEAEFSRLYDDHSGAVLAYCLRRLGPADAQDAAAEVFTIAWSKRAEAPPEEKRRSWLYGIAYRVIGHQWRSRSRRHRLRNRVAAVPSNPTSSPEAAVVQRLESRMVIEAARRLRPTDREILRLAGWEELPHAEIATLLGISTAAVDQRFHRAKERLAREYDRIRPARLDVGGET